MISYGLYITTYMDVLPCICYFTCTFPEMHLHTYITKPQKTTCGTYTADINLTLRVTFIKGRQPREIKTSQQNRKNPSGVGHPYTSRTTPVKRHVHAQVLNLLQQI